MFVCVCVYMTKFICTRVYMTMFIVYLCLCLYDNVHLCLCLHDRVHLYLCLYDNVLLPPDERVSQLPHCYAWCHRGIRGADKTKQKSHPLTRMLPPLGFQSKEPAVNEWGRRSRSIVNTNGQECQDAGTRLAKYEALVTEQRTRSTGSSTIVQRESRHQTQLVLVCWKRTHICSNSDGGWDRSLLAPDMDHTLTTTCEIATFSVTFSILSFLKLFLQCW